MDQDNVRSQQQLYGEPIADIVGRIGRNLAMNQAQVARGVGLSAPMLSHLVSGRRVKIGNPQALTRLHALDELARQVEAGQVSPGPAQQRVSEIIASDFDWAETTTRRRTETAPDPQATVREMQAVFRSVAGAEEWLQVVTELRTSHPRIAELIHAYAVARTDEAIAHWHRHRGG